jgi:hypothetical protein
MGMGFYKPSFLCMFMFMRFSKPLQKMSLVCGWLFIFSGVHGQVQKPILDSVSGNYTCTRELTEFTKFSQVPRYIKRYINSKTPGRFRIAEADQAWNGGCTIYGNLPRKQFVSAFMCDDTFHMTFLQGGFAAERKRIEVALVNQKPNSFRIK